MTRMEELFRCLYNNKKKGWTNAYSTAVEDEDRHFSGDEITTDNRVK